MQMIKLGIFKVKTFFLKICLVVGVITVVQFIYGQGQSRLNTVANKTRCSVMVNPSYGDKIKCTTVSLLSFSNQVNHQIRSF